MSEKKGPWAMSGTRKGKSMPTAFRTQQKVQLWLPYPPTVNHYYVHTANRVVLGKAGREYRARVEEILEKKGWPRVSGRVKVKIEAHPPDARKRDLDNIRKALNDAISDQKYRGRRVHVGIIEDDAQIKADEATMCEPIEREYAGVWLTVYEYKDLESLWRLEGLIP